MGEKGVGWERGREREIRCAPPEGELTQSVWEADRHPCLSSMPSIPFNPFFSRPSHLIIVRVLFFFFTPAPLLLLHPLFFLWSPSRCGEGSRVSHPEYMMYAVSVLRFGHELLFFSPLHYYNVLRMLQCSLVPGICSLRVLFLPEYSLMLSQR